MSIVRQLDTASASKLGDLVETFEELQFVLRCCERLVTELDTSQEDVDGVLVEAVWTTALLSYARCFSSGERDAVLGEQDLRLAQPEGDVLGWHQVLLRLRDHQAQPAASPRERIYVGVAQDDSGAPAGVAVTSTPQPMVDDVTVRQLGAIAFALVRRVDDQIKTQQEKVSSELKDVSAADLEGLARIDVTTSAEPS